TRQARRRRGTSAPLAAEAAARAVRAGPATGRPKAGAGPGEMVRALQVARRAAVRARPPAANQRHALAVTAPERVREPLRPLSPPPLVATACAPPPPRPAPELALPGRARRPHPLSPEPAAIDLPLARLLARGAPALPAVTGVGPDPGRPRPRRRPAGDGRRHPRPPARRGGV